MSKETYFIGTRNTAEQTIPAGGALALGEVYRRYICRGKCGLTTFDTTGTAITVNHSGFYKAVAMVTFSAAAAGDVTIQLTENGVAIPGALATETITTPDTEFRTVTIPFRFLVNKGCVAGIPTVLAKNISVTSDVAITVTNYVLDVESTN